MRRALLSTSLIAVETKVASGYFATSKKSAVFKCFVRSGVSVVSESVLIVILTRLCSTLPV